jgi:hypothetical protein
MADLYATDSTSEVEMTKPIPSLTRRTALAIAAASAGVTLAITATLASSLGLIAPYPAPPVMNTATRQPTQQAPAPLFTDGLAKPATPVSSQPSNAVAVAHREHDDTERSEQARRSAPTSPSVERSASPLTSRTNRKESDDD